MAVFVPEWGWVGSGLMKWAVKSNSRFRPRVGMGWFLIKVCMKYGVKLFSSPSGDGLVHRTTEMTNTQAIDVFVPAWGWVGSRMVLCSLKFSSYFRPRVGMGWFFKIKELKTNEKVFVPEWGWVGSVRWLSLSPV